MDLLYSERSSASRGTLSQLKNAYNHRSVKKKVMENFNHAEDFVRFCAEGYTVLLALKELKMENMDSKCQISYEDLKMVARRIVQQVWLYPSTEEIQSMIDADAQDSNDTAYAWCICGEGN